MAEFSSIATQTVAVNGNVLFTDAPTSVCKKGYISHRTGSGLINLKGATNTCKAKYRVEFNGNIAVPTGGTAGAISLAIAVEGEPDLSTLESLHQQQLKHLTMCLWQQMYGFLALIVGAVSSSLNPFCTKKSSLKQSILIR